VAAEGAGARERFATGRATIASRRWRGAARSQRPDAALARRAAAGSALRIATAVGRGAGECQRAGEERRTSDMTTPATER